MEVSSRLNFSYLCAPHQLPTAPRQSRSSVSFRISTLGCDLLDLRSCYTSTFLKLLLATGTRGEAVFAVVFLLNLITDLTISLGSTSIAPTLSVGGAIGVFLALPGCVFGLASGLVICNSFVADTWNGSHLLKRYCFGNFSATIFDWSLFFCLLAFPVITMSCCLLARLDNWWEIGLLTWFVSVTCLYVLYAFTITHFEVAACWSLVLSLSEQDGETTTDPPFWKTVRACILTIQTYTIAGYKDVRYLTTGSTLSMGQNSSHSDIPSRTFFDKNYFERTRWFARLTMLGCCSGSKSPKFYHVLDEPRQVWTVDEAKGARSFQTRSTWSLEKVYCRTRITRMVSVVRGPEALSLTQIRSSLVCSFVGKFLGVLLLIGFAVYLRLSAALIALLVVLLLVFWIIPRGIMSLRLFNTVMRVRDCAQHLEAVPEGGNEDSASKGDDENVAYNQDDDEEQEEAGNTYYSSRGFNDAVYVVSETYRVTEPSPWYSWFGFALEFGLFFLWPFISILQLKNYYIALEFFFLMIFSFFRRFFNPAVALQEVGSIKASTRRKHAKHWRRQSRFSTILDEVTINRSRYIWTVVLVFLLVFLLVVCFLAIGEDTDTTESSPNIHNTRAGKRLGLLSDFEYPPNAGLTYPTCVIGKNFLPGQDEARLVDYTFASLLAYKDRTIVQDEIDLWFGEGMVTDEFELVNAYRIETGSATLPVSYKLFNITNGPLVVTIRGTQGAFDLLADAQLWSTALFMQLVRFAMPLGHMWTPIFDDLVYAISGGLQSTTAKSVAFYRETTGFVEYLKQSGLEGGQGITITGHSLGGGLAIITGTQTKEPAITISGPNAM